MIPLSTPLMHATLESSKLEPAKCVSAQAPAVFGSISGGLETHCFCLALGGVAEPGTLGEGGGRLLGCLAACGGCRDRTKKKEFGRHYLTRPLANSSSTADSGCLSYCVSFTLFPHAQYPISDVPTTPRDPQSDLGVCTGRGSPS